MFTYSTMKPAHVFKYRATLYIPGLTVDDAKAFLRLLDSDEFVDDIRENCEEPEESWEEDPKPECYARFHDTPVGVRTYRKVTEGSILLDVCGTIINDEYYFPNLREIAPLYMISVDGMCIDEYYGSVEDAEIRVKELRDLDPEIEYKIEHIEN